MALCRYAMNDSYAFIFRNIQKVQYAFKAFKQETFIIERRPHGVCKKVLPSFSYSFDICLHRGMQWESLLRPVYISCPFPHIVCFEDWNKRYKKCCRAKNSLFCLNFKWLSLLQTKGRDNCQCRYNTITFLKGFFFPLKKGPHSLPHTAPLALCFSYGNCCALNTECSAKHLLRVQLCSVMTPQSVY